MQRNLMIMSVCVAGCAHVMSDSDMTSTATVGIDVPELGDRLVAFVMASSATTTPGSQSVLRWGDPTGEG